jgi:hypothetical protein
MKLSHQGDLRFIVGSFAGRSDARMRDDVKSHPQSQRSALSGFASEQCGQEIIAENYSPSQRLRMGG